MSKELKNWKDLIGMRLFDVAFEAINRGIQTLPLIYLLSNAKLSWQGRALQTCGE